MEAHLEASASFGSKEETEAEKGKAEDAKESIETAEDKAEDAKESIETAEDKAEDPKKSTETAEDKAEEPKKSTETVEDKAEEPKESIETAEDLVYLGCGEATEIVETVLESYILTRSAESQGKTDVLKALEVDSQLTDGTFLDEFKKRKQCEKQREEEEVSLGGTTLVLGEENPTQDTISDETSEVAEDKQNEKIEKRTRSPTTVAHFVVDPVPKKKSRLYTGAAGFVDGYISSPSEAAASPKKATAKCAAKAKAKAAAAKCAAKAKAKATNKGKKGKGGGKGKEKDNQKGRGKGKGQNPMKAKKAKAKAAMKKPSAKKEAKEATDFGVRYGLLLVQLIPFNETADQQDGIINANGATVASAMMIIFCCCALCPVVAIFLRRMKPAAAGKTEIKDSKGNLFVVNYQRTEVIEETKTIHDDENEEVEEKKKVLVKWDIDVAAMMRRLNTLRGHRWVSMDLAANRIKETPTMTKECSKSITKRNLARSEVSGEDERDEDGKMMSTMQTQRSEVFGPMESMKTESDVEVSPTAVAVNATIPPEREDEQKSETIEVVVDDVLDAVWREIYQDRAPVSYWSVTHQRLIQGFIVGKGIADDSSATSSEDIKLPCYDVRVGVRNQYRHAVPVMHLEPSLQVNESVHVWVETWQMRPVAAMNVKISNCLHSAGMYQVMVFPHRDDDDFPEDMQDPLVIDNVSLERLRRRFAKNTPVLIYRGLNVGWFHAMIVEDVIQDLQPPAVMSPRDMFITPRKIDKRPEATLSTEDRETSEDQEDEIQPTVAVAAPSEVPNTIVQVKIRVAGADEVEEVPSYLISVIPEILAV
eukprot:symbB.v1.2.007025.t1/scaffold427.1/size208084/7